MKFRTPVTVTFAVFIKRSRTSMIAIGVLVFWFAVVVASALAEEPLLITDEIGTALVCNATNQGVVCYES